jgi:hypothetical protein
MITSVQCYPLSNGGLRIDWSGTDGFGILLFTTVGGKLVIDSECMGPEFVKSVLAKAVDSGIIK